MATITLKNVPDDLYETLKARAQADRRSINAQAIHCLEAALTLSEKMSPEDEIRWLRRVRPQIDPYAVSDEEIQEAIDSGRP